MRQRQTHSGAGSTRTALFMAILLLLVTGLVAVPVAAQDTEPVPCPTTTTTTTTTIPPTEGLAVADLPPVEAEATTTEDCVPAEEDTVEETTTTIATTTTAPRQVIGIDDEVTAVMGQEFESVDVTENDTISPSLAGFDIVSGRMPDGLTLWDRGALRGWIIGTPEECGNFTAEYRIEATAADGTTSADTATVTLLVSCQSGPQSVTVTDDEVLATEGQRVEVDVVANDQPSAAVAWIELDSGELPTGMTLWAGGWLTGTPTEAGRYSFTYRVNGLNRVDGVNDASDTATVTVTVE